MDNPDWKTEAHHMIARRLLMARKWCNLDLPQLADKSGLPVSLLEKYENCEQALSSENLLLLSGLLRQPTDFFLGRHGTKGLLDD